MNYIDTSLRDSVANSLSQTAERIAFRAGFAGNPTVKLYGGGLHLGTLTAAGFIDFEGVPLSLKPGVTLPGWATGADFVSSSSKIVDEARLFDGATERVRCDVTMAQPMNILCAPDLTVGIVFIANPVKPRFPIDYHLHTPYASLFSGYSAQVEWLANSSTAALPLATSGTPRIVHMRGATQVAVYSRFKDILKRYTAPGDAQAVIQSGDRFVVDPAVYDDGGVGDSMQFYVGGASSDYTIQNITVEIAPGAIAVPVIRPPSYAAGETYAGAGRRIAIQNGFGNITIKGIGVSGLTYSGGTAFANRALIDIINANGTVKFLECRIEDAADQEGFIAVQGMHSTIDFKGHLWVENCTGFDCGGENGPAHMFYLSCAPWTETGGTQKLTFKNNYLRGVYAGDFLKTYFHINEITNNYFESKSTRDNTRPYRHYGHDAGYQFFGQSSFISLVFGRGATITGNIFVGSEADVPGGFAYIKIGAEYRRLDDRDFPAVTEYLGTTSRQLVHGGAAFMASTKNYTIRRNTFVRKSPYWTSASSGYGRLKPLVFWFGVVNNVTGDPDVTNTNQFVDIGTTALAANSVVDIADNVYAGFSVAANTGETGAINIAAVNYRGTNAGNIGPNDLTLDFIPTVTVPTATYPAGTQYAHVAGSMTRAANGIIGARA